MANLNGGIHFIIAGARKMVVGIGIPIKLLHESQGLIVTLELKTGALYRGKLHEVEDNMNIQLTQVTVTARDGRLSQMDQVFVRGSQIRFIVVPDNLRNAPFFVTKGKGKGIGMGRGRAIIAAAGRGRAVPARPPVQ